MRTYKKIQELLCRLIFQINEISVQMDDVTTVHCLVSWFRKILINLNVCKSTLSNNFSWPAIITRFIYKLICTKTCSFTNDASSRITVYNTKKRILLNAIFARHNVFRFGIQKGLTGKMLCIQRK
jgi:hypothetical protein